MPTMLGLVGAKRTVPGLWRLSNTCFLLLNSLLFSFCSLGFYGGLTSSLFCSSESLAVCCVQHSFPHLTPPSMYVAKGQPRCPPHPPSPRSVPPTPSSSSIDVNARFSDAFLTIDFIIMSKVWSLCMEFYGAWQINHKVQDFHRSDLGNIGY